MVPTFTLGFLDLIENVLRQASKGIASSHHLHNVQSGIANILDLLQYDDGIADAAGQLTRMAASYINRHNLVPVVITDKETDGDADRLRAAFAALAHFRSTLEGAQPNRRVHTLGLG